MTTAGSLKRRWSLRTHLTWVVLLALLPALAIQYVSNLERRQESQVRAQELLMQLVDTLARQQEQVAASAQQILTTLSFLPQLHSGDDPALSRILRSLQEEDRRFANLLALDPEGRVLASALPASNQVATDRMYFKEALRTLRFTVGEYVIGRVSGVPTLHFALPVLDGHRRVTAVLVAAYNTDHYRELFNTSTLPADTSLSLADHSGTVLFHQSRLISQFGSLVGTRLHSQQLLGSSSRGSYWAPRQDGERTLYAFSQIRTNGASRPYLYLQVGRPEYQVLGESIRADRRNMLLLLVTGALALVAARAVGHRMIANPIRTLVESSRHIGQGGLYHRPELRVASREVAKLGEELGRMSRALALREEEQLRTQEALLNTQRLESLGVLTGGIAHDFNNLLAAVQGNLNLAQLQLDPGGTAYRALEQAEMAVEKAADLTRQMLAYSGRGHVVVKPIDLNQMVDEMIHLLHVTLSKKTTLVLDLAPQLPSVLADGAQIQQVVLNLVTNAAEAIGHQEGNITVRTRAEGLDEGMIELLCPSQGLEAGTYAVLEVTDSGCGMEPELIERIFDPFFTTKPTGHGLGLSAIHGILRTHRAGIHILSAPGAGTTFQILFPASQEALPTLSHPSSAPWISFEGLALVADDEPMVLDFAVTALESMGFTVVSARDGAEALARFQSAPSRIRLVLLDLTMPRMDGLEVFAELRKAQPDLPFILSSGYDADASAQKLVELGQVYFLPKPYPFRDLRQAVLEVLAEVESVRSPERPSPGA